MAEQRGCNCGKVQYNLVFACSGAADVGAISDQAARVLSREKTASMCCTAAIAAEIPDIMEKAALANRIVVIDGCEKSCAQKILDKGGFDDYAYVELGALGMEKGKTPVAQENVAKAAAATNEALARDMLLSLTESPQLGHIYTGKVVRVADFGAFVEILPNVDGMVHISQLDSMRVNKVEDIARVGDEITVMVTGIDDSGKIRLSRQAVLENWTLEEAIASDSRKSKSRGQSGRSSRGRSSSQRRDRR